MPKEKPIDIPVPRNTGELTKTCFELANHILKGNLTPTKGKAISHFYQTGLRSMIAQYNAEKESGIKPDMTWFSNSKD